MLARSPFSLVRSPRMDQFLETHLQELATRDYAIDATVVRDDDGTYRLHPGAPAANANVLFELWRRAADAR